MQAVLVTGGQFGSEGKGAVCSWLAKRFDFDFAIRTGGPNAGHTIAIDGQTYKLRQLPSAVGMPDLKLVLGPGSVVDPDVLDEDMAKLPFPTSHRLFIDPRATVIAKGHKDWEKSSQSLVHIGSTQSGVGRARMARMSRDTHDGLLAGDCRWPFGVLACVESVIPGYANVLVEGSQGYGLSLHYGAWPYVTSQDCTAYSIMNDAGLPWGIPVRHFMVLRKYPIRVGGLSGPLPKETTWHRISELAGREVRETTTVTGKTRRVAEFDFDLVLEAVWRNRPNYIILTFADYDCPDNAGCKDWMQLSWKTRRDVAALERATGVCVAAVGVGFAEGDFRFCMQPDTDCFEPL